MALRLQKRIQIFKGLNLNVSKSSTSWTLDGRGASVNLKDSKAPGEHDSSALLLTVAGYAETVGRRLGFFDYAGWGSKWWRF